MTAVVPLRLLLLVYYIFSWLAIKQPGSSGAVLGQRLPEWAGWAKFPASLRRSGTQGASAPSPFSSLLLRVRSGRFKDSVQATPFLAPSYSLTFSSSVTRSPLWSLVLRGSVELCALFFGASALFFSFHHSFIHPFIHSSMHPFIHSSIHSFTSSFVHSFIRSFVPSFLHSSIHPFIHSSIHPSIHLETSATCWMMRF